MPEQAMMGLPLDASARMPLGGVNLEVRAIDGPHEAAGRAPLVFLHEGLGCVSLWRQRGRDWPTELCHASGRRGWLYSRRGYGSSDPIDDVRGRGRHGPDYMHREAWQTLPALLRAWGLRQPPVLVGHSDGATIALLYAARHPVAGCIAIAPHVLVEKVALQAIAAARNAYLHSDLRARLARHHADPDSAFWQWNDVWLSEAFRSFDIRAECRRIQAPLLLVQGEQDEYGTLAQLDAIAAAAPQAQRVVLPACGHSPHRDQPDALLQACLAWLAPLP
ncbi:MAG: alpha/beta hydrolase [Tepidimonas sp.]|uniref:alpha/beta fold hydrolase n=1 Tax=Tepidimonas sp. TaxID=2002775 RepID=UPI00298F3BAD|nr:alpha/beta hydrolase [Tepidimonas sp.]MCS6810420.1 alpha/beta hydrolase [Tepidimonas sp.]MDW8336599.1 alpha/beta hydrolase [Tepidimonas sp.]